MSPDRSRRGLQVLLVGLGCLTTVTGAAVLARGSRAVTGVTEPVPASVDSELRWFATWWTAVGPLLWRLVPRVESETRAVRYLSGVVLAGGVTRLVSVRQAGRPHPVFLGLTAVELVLPAVLVVWQRRVAAAHRR